ALHAEGDGVTTAETQGREAGGTVPVAQGIQESREHSSTAGPDWMAQGDGAAVHIHPVPVPAELPAIGQRLDREGLVGLNQVVVLNPRVGLAHERADRQNRGEEEISRLTAAGSIAGDSSQRRESVGAGESE